MLFLTIKHNPINVQNIGHLWSLVVVDFASLPRWVLPKEEETNWVYSIWKKPNISSPFTISWLTKYVHCSNKYSIGWDCIAIHSTLHDLFVIIYLYPGDNKFIYYLYLFNAI